MRRLPIGRDDLRLWVASGVIVLTVHAAGVAALFANWRDDGDLAANSPVITIDLAPVPVAPEVTPTDVPVGPQQTEAEPEAQPEPPVEEKVEAPVVPQAEPLTMAQPPKPIETPPEKPKEKKPMQKHASLPTAPSAAEHRDVRAAAPMPGANSQNSNAVPTWRSQLVARLERYKRYPSDAHGDQGTATLGFSVDRSGGVHNARIVRSSGSGALDRETLALIGRAAPMPPPPPEAVGAQIAIVAPIRYNTR